MPTVIIAKNQTAGDLPLKGLSAPDAKIPASGQVTLTDYNFVWDIQEDVELRAYINAGSVLLSVNGKDLNKAESLNAASAPAMAKNTDDLHNTQQEPTGFPNRTDSAISRVDGTRTFTIQPAVTGFDFFIAGTKYTKTVAQTKVWNDAEGLHYFYFDTAGVLQVTQVFTADLILKYALVALLYWDFTNKVSILFADERHGIQMNGETHLHFHYSFGARWSGGLALQGITADGDGNSNGSAQFAIQNGSIRDEDLYHSISNGSPQTLSPTAQIPIYYRSGAAGSWRKKTADSFPVIYQGTAGYPATQRLPYNSYVGGTWGFTEVANGSFVCVLFFGTNNVGEPFIGIQGQNFYSTISEARTGAQVEIRNVILTGLPIPEMTPIGVVIFQTSTSYTNTPKARIRSNGVGGTYIDLRRTDLVGVPDSEVTGGIFGADYQRAESLAEENTSLLTYQDKVTLVVPARTGAYRVAYSAMVKNADKQGSLRFYNVTDVATLEEIPFRVKDSANRYDQYGSACEVVFTGTSKTFKVQWVSLDGQAQYIKNAYIEIWRVY